MSVQTINIELPADILLTLNENEQELKQQIKQALALQLYRKQKVTLGKAAQIAELSRLAFENLLAENNIPISHLGLDDVLSDVEKLR
jgi:predicted HTH domain antitoxin